MGKISLHNSEKNLMAFDGDLATSVVRLIIEEALKVGGYPIYRGTRIDSETGDWVVDFDILLDGKIPDKRPFFTYPNNNPFITNPEKPDLPPRELVGLIKEIGLEERHGPNIPEKPPVTNNHPFMWDIVINDMKERDNSGEKKYRTRLQPFNGRDQLWDAYQEVLDLAVYLRNAIYERDYNENNSA